MRKVKIKTKKGQVRIILELFLFALGIMIALFSSTFFTQFSGWISKTAEEDQLKLASSAISCGIVKAHELNANAIINLDLLSSINENSYFIEAFDNQLLLYDIYNYSLRSSIGLFYISEDKNINGSVGSSTGKIIVRASEYSIEILR
ncbi:MAG: hypothetical protein QXJ96_01320 [Candidatus Aenigmatarchaeota archaeon]|nr:hypothetical protein [Candidatus Aenigmarchaeota archaeon]